MPMISVIVPVYNGEKTIAETIQSVLDQTFSDFELIIVNSSSTDNTLEIVSKFQDPRIQVFTYPKASVAVNRNRGFAHASGQFVTFIDADDLWTPDKLERQYHCLKDNPTAGVVYSWTKCIDEQGKFLRRCSDVDWSGNVLPRLLLDDFIGNGSNVMIRREAFTQVGGFDEGLTNAQDTDLWLRLAQEYPFAVVTAPQILYRISCQSMSSDVLNLETANLKVIERSFTAAPDSLQYLKPYAIANLYKYLAYKALDAMPGKQKTGAAARYIARTVLGDPAMLKTPVIYKAILKLMIMALLPPKAAQVFLTKFPRLANTSTFLGYEKLDVLKS